MYVALRKSIHFREIFQWAFTDGVTTSVNMWLCCRQALVFWLNNFDYFTVWCLLLLGHLKRKLTKSTIMPVEVLISIVKDWYEWLVSGLVHLLSNDPFRRSGLMPCTHVEAVQKQLWQSLTESSGFLSYSVGRSDVTDLNSDTWLVNCGYSACKLSGRPGVLTPKIAVGRPELHTRSSVRRPD